MFDFSVFPMGALNWTQNCTSRLHNMSILIPISIGYLYEFVVEFSGIPL